MSPRALNRLTSWWRARLAHLRDEPDAGYTTEAILVTALFVAIAVAAVALIGTAVYGWVDDIVTSI